MIKFTERIQILVWVYLNRKKFTSNPDGPYRWYIEIEDYDVPSVFYKVRDRILKSIDFDYRLVRNQKTLITMNTDGGFIQEHTDEHTPGYDHLRYNLCILKPLKGGRHIIEGKCEEQQTKEVKVIDVRYRHASEKVYGIIPRVAMSVGVEKID